RRTELAVIDTTDNGLDQVTAIPGNILRQSRAIDHWSLPFRIVVRSFYQNSRLRILSEAGKEEQIVVQSAPRATGVDEHDVPSAAIEIIPKQSGTSLGTRLASDALGAPQTFSFDGRNWMIAPRPMRYYKPYSVSLQKFTHESYAGTEIPKNFSSRVT